MPETHVLTAIVPEANAGCRLDQAAAVLFPQFSRSRLKRWILDGRLTVDGETRRPRDVVGGGEALHLEAATEPEVEIRPQAIPLEIVYEDQQIIVVNKPAGLVVHPGAGNPDGTMQNALLHYRPALADIPRAGIVHRLDKDTSGLLVVAGTLAAQTGLVRQLEAHSVTRRYDAICVGVMTAGGTIDAPIGRHRVDRLRMAVRDGGRPAITHYRVRNRFRGHTHVEATLETGRTHQIRVHLAHAGYPLLGDPVYGGRLRLPAGATATLVAALRGFRRQALHARELTFEHPATAEPVTWQASMPADLAALVDALANDADQVTRS